MFSRVMPIFRLRVREITGLPLTLNTRRNWSIRDMNPWWILSVHDGKSVEELICPWWKIRRKMIYPWRKWSVRDKTDLSVMKNPEKWSSRDASVRSWQNWSVRDEEPVKTRPSRNASDLSVAELICPWWTDSVAELIRLPSLVQHNCSLHRKVIIILMA